MRNFHFPGRSTVHAQDAMVATSHPLAALAAADVSWYLERNIHAVPLTSAHAVSVPGAIDAWQTILRDHGKFGLDTLLQPAIKAAEEGYVVAPRIAFAWKNDFEKLKQGHNTE